MRMKRLLPTLAIGSIALCSLLFTACYKDDEPTQPEPDPTPIKDPDPVAKNTYKYLSTKIFQFKHVLPKAQEMPDELLTTYFGRRIELNQPEEVQFKNDSITILKPYGLQEKFKVKWDKGDLFYYKADETWAYMGRIETDETLRLNLGAYSLTNKSEQRSLTVVEQGYDLTSPDALREGSDANTSLVWLSLQYIME